MLFTPCLSSPMPSRKHRLDSKDAALANGPLKGSTRLQEVLRPVSPVFLSLSACVLLLAIVVRWGAHSPYLLFNVGSLEETGHYEGSAVYDSVYRGMHPFLKCTWSRNLCRLYVRVESCPVRPEEWVSDRSIAEQVRYMDKHGPNAFHLRVVGGWDIQALSVVDFAVSRVANDDGCLYTSRSIDLRTPGEVTFELWHMYSNFTGWKILNPGSLFNPSETMQYPARTFSGFETQQVWTLLNDIYMVPSMSSIGLRSSLLSRRFDSQRLEAFRVIPETELVSSVLKQSLCDIQDIHSGAWMADPNSPCFQRMKRFGRPTEEIFDDCIRSFRFVPESCVIARHSNEKTRHLLYHGGMGAVSRMSYSGSKARKIVLVGDSHIRTLGNGLILRLSDPQSEAFAQFHLPDAHAFPASSPVIDGKVEVHYCVMRNPSRETIDNCLSFLKLGIDDVLIVGSAAWPLSTHESGRILAPDEYRAGITGMRNLFVDILDSLPYMKIYWMSSIAQPLTDCYYWGSISDHRNDALNSMLNDIARDVFSGTLVRFFDVFNLTLSMNNAAFDNAHYSLFVMREMVDALLTDLM